MRRVGEAPKIERLPADAHKGDRGRVLVVAGSLRMSGAARLAAWGALRGGAGLVTVAVPDVIQAIVAADLPCAMTLPLASRKGGFAAAGGLTARKFAAEVDAVVLGPGITTEVMPFVRRFLRGLETPIVLDADALNLIAEDPKLLATTPAVRVLTPHPGEAERLLGDAPGKTRDARVKAAAELSDRFHCVAVLKGAGTVVCDGDRYFVNKTGGPGLATGGTGDVLTGVIAARLARGAEPFPAAAQAVHVHGRAGDLAAAAVGPHSTIATDVVANLGAAIGELLAPPKKRDKKSDDRGSRRRRRDL